VAEEFTTTDEQRALRELVDDWTAKRWTQDQLRRVVEDGDDPRAELTVLGRDLGLLALATPEGLGGGGAGVVEASVVAERLGRALVPLPYAGTTLALDLLAATGRADLVGPVAAGTRTVAVVVATDLTGATEHVVGAAGADDLLVVVGSELYRVEASSARVEPAVPLDLTRPQATVHLDGAPAERLGEVDLAAATDRALVCVAAEALGAAEHLLTEAAAYAGTRIQFGRAIGSYQGVKHRLADVLVAVEQTRSLVEHAAWTHDHGGDDPALATSLARLHSAATLQQAARASVQVHGGIGFTWEHHAHLYFKRAHSDALLWGGLAPHRARVAAHLDRQ
jgi:alkylation response protein AidB-like acyl-CoA dehydrogenase